MNFVTLEKTGNKLRLTLSTDGRTELHRRVDEGESIASDSALYEVLEDHLCNGWEWIRPDELGALTSAPILRDDCSRDDQGLLDQVGAVYWFPNYQILSPTEELFRTGHVDFDRAE